MNFTKTKLLFKINITSALLTHILLLCLSVGITGMTFLLLPQPKSTTVDLLIQTPLLFLLNFLVICACVYFIYSLCGSFRLSFLVSALLFFLLLTINRYKVYMRGDPFMPNDLFLGGEAMSIMSSAEVKISPFIIAIPMLILLAFIILCLFFGFKKPSLRERFFSLSVCLIFALVSPHFVYQNSSVYHSLPIKGNVNNSTNEYISKGFLIPFIYHFGDFSIKVPIGYSSAKADAILQKYTDNNNGESELMPDIFIVMSESFYDITQIDALDFSGFEDPVKVFRELSSESISGDLYVSSFGGGTDATEFSVLTGFSTWAFNYSLPSAYKFYIRKTTPSLASFLKTKGYQAEALHPHHGWFYNRNNVYRWFGFDRFVNFADFTGDIISGNYVSDAANFDMLKEMYENHLSTSSAPYFNYNVTIQNHGPYDGGYMYDDKEPNFALKPGVQISDTSKIALTNYIKGLKDANVALEEFKEYLQRSERPAVLVFFGDHLPILGNNYLIYRELGSIVGTGYELEQLTETYHTEFLIWANDACKEVWPEYEALTGQQIQLSTNALGMYLLDKLGFETDPLYSYLIDFTRKVPVMNPWFHSRDIERGKGLTMGSAADLIEDYRTIQYRELFDR